MQTIELIDKPGMQFTCPICGTLLIDGDNEFQVCDHVLFVAVDDGGFAYIKDGVGIDPDPDLDEMELNMDDYTSSLEFENSFKVAFYTPAPSGFGAYWGFQQK